jgi:hypothetical protein
MLRAIISFTGKVLARQYIHVYGIYWFDMRR